MYQWRTDELGRGLWGTDPPKVAADIVEALIGAVFMDSGFESGIDASLRILEPMCSALQAIRDKDSSIVMVHPKKVLQEIGGSVLELKVIREDKFASLKPTTPLWLGKRWGTARPDGTCFVACIECLGTAIVSVSDPSIEVAGNRACALMVEMLTRDSGLLARLKTLRTMVESCSSREAKQLPDEENLVLYSSISKTGPGDASADIATGAAGGKPGPIKVADPLFHMDSHDAQLRPLNPQPQERTTNDMAGSCTSDTFVEDNDSEIEALIRSVVASVLPDS